MYMLICNIIYNNICVCENKSWIVSSLKPVYFSQMFLFYFFYIYSYLLYCLNNMSTVIGLHSQKKNLNHQKFQNRYLEIILLSDEVLYLLMSHIICLLVVLFSLLSCKVIFMQIISATTFNGIFLW